MILDQSFISVVLDYNVSQTNGQQPGVSSTADCM